MYLLVQIPQNSFLPLHLRYRDLVGTVGLDHFRSNHLSNLLFILEGLAKIILEYSRLLEKGCKCEFVLLVLQEQHLLAGHEDECPGPQDVLFENVY